MNQRSLESMDRLESVDVLGVPFCPWSMQQTVKWIVGKLQFQEAAGLVHIVTANPEIVMGAQEHQGLRQAILAADLVTADGTGVVWAANYLGTPVAERVAGYDMLHELCRATRAHPLRVYLLGAKEETNKLAAEKLEQLYPHLQIVGRRNGYFQAEAEQAIIEEINRTQPQLLLVALGFPRQELWIHQYKEQLQVQVAIGVGGSLDVLAGTVKRAPLVWQKLRLEWFYRLLQEPSRWRRQLVLPQFVLEVRKKRKMVAKNVK